MFDSSLQRLTTMFYGVVDNAMACFTYTNAGHSPAFLIRKSGDVERLQTEDALLGEFLPGNTTRFTVTPGGG